MVRRDEKDDCAVVIKNKTGRKIVREFDNRTGIGNTWFDEGAEVRVNKVGAEFLPSKAPPGLAYEKYDPSKHPHSDGENWLKPSERDRQRRQDAMREKAEREAWERKRGR